MRGWKHRYQVKIGNNDFILPIQWNQATSRWVPYNLQNWYNEDGSLKQPSIDKYFEMGSTTWNLASHFSFLIDCNWQS